MTKNTTIILGAIMAIIIVGGVVIIYPNYRNEIADDAVKVVDTIDNRIYGEMSTLRIEQDIDIYTKEAEAIVIGNFISRGLSQWNGDKTYIKTVTYFLVSESLKGNIKPDTEIKLLQWGGEIDKQVQIMEGAFVYNERQRNLLYLGKDEDDNWGVFQGDWGQFLIDQNGMTKDFNGKAISLPSFKNLISERIK